MSREDDFVLRASFRGGITEDEDFADPRLHCADARDLWSPEGSVELRPQAEHVGWATRQCTSGTPYRGEIVVEDGEGNFNNPPWGAIALGGFPTTDFGRIYFPAPVDAETIGVGFDVTVSNTNGVTYWWEYYSSDGKWKALSALEMDGGVRLGTVLGAYPNLFGSTTQALFWMSSPIDRAAVDVAGRSVTYRVTIVSTGVGNRLSAGTEINTTNTVPVIWSTTADALVGAGSVASPRGRAFYYATARVGFGLEITKGADIAARQPIHYRTGQDQSIEEPMSFAPVPQFEEVFMAYNGRCYEWSLLNELNTPYLGGVSNESSAKVESRDFAVGPDAPYDPALVPQRGDFPAARYILFANGRLWAIEGNNTLCWSAAAPFHRVFPLQAAETVGSLRVTGLAKIGEQVAVFNESEIYIIVPNGTSANGVASFIPRRVSAGVGAISNAGISEFTKGALVFPGRDGLYVYNGVGEPKNILENRLSNFWQRLNFGNARFFVGAAWASKHHYLLAVEVADETPPLTLPGATLAASLRRNTHVIVWDYQSNALWVWRGMSPAHWIFDADGGLHYIDEAARIMRVGSCGRGYDQRPGAPFLESHRLRSEDETSKTIRHVFAVGSNTCEQLTVTIAKNDESMALGSAAIMPMQHPALPRWTGGLTWTAALAAARRWVSYALGLRRVDVRKTGYSFVLRVEWTAGASNKLPLEAELSRVGVASSITGVR